MPLVCYNLVNWDFKWQLICFTVIFSIFAFVS